MFEGWHGWDEYAAYYDWENARSIGRRDIAFWRRVVAREAAPTLELGCGTGRLLGPLARAGGPLTGIDRSPEMLVRAAARTRRIARAVRPRLTRGDIRALPFRTGTFGVVVAAYGILQSLVRDTDLTALLGETARVLRPGGLLGIDLIPDVPNWQESGAQVTHTGRSRDGGRISLIETVRQDRRRRLTIFAEEFVEQPRHGNERRRRFTLTFRTVTLPALARKLERHGFAIEARFGDYAGGPLGFESDAWLVLARRRNARC